MAGCMAAGGDGLPQYKAASGNPPANESAEAIFSVGDESDDEQGKKQSREDRDSSDQERQKNA